MHLTCDRTRCHQDWIGFGLIKQLLKCPALRDDRLELALVSYRVK
jgi:hypothetical protein